MDISKNSGEKLNEGKTKIIYEYKEDNGFVIIHSKDRITAGNGLRSDDLTGKAEVSNETTSIIFQLLNNAGIKTHFAKQISPKEFLAKRCDMIPIEFVVRRIATGSFLKRNTGVEEGYKFCPPKQEYFFKDDINNDPQWSKEQILCNFSKKQFGLNDCKKILTKGDLDTLDAVTRAVFEILEKYWDSVNCQLVDMKVEYGVDVKTGEILLADIIDSDSWRLWPSGDKKLMVDKQVYRDLKLITENDLQTILKNFSWVLTQIKEILNRKHSIRLVVIMGSPSDIDFCKEIEKHCDNLGISCLLRVASAHKQPQRVEDIVSSYDGDGVATIYVAVAGRSNGLGPVLAGLTTSPVINCPPIQPAWAAQDIWSSLRLPSGLGCTTVLGAEAAVVAAAQMLAINDSRLWARLRAMRLNESTRLTNEDALLEGLRQGCVVNNHV